MVVNGTCTAAGEIWIKGNLTVNGNSVFDAEHGGIINGNVQAWPGSVLVLVEFNITHSVSASGARSVELEVDDLGQGVLIQGGGGAPAGACNRHDVPITGVPEARVDGNEFLGNVTIAGRGGCGNAIFSNDVSGNVNFVNNMAGSSSEQFVQSNAISGNLFWKNNNPHPILGGNSVGGTINFPGDCNT